MILTCPVMVRRSPSMMCALSPQLPSLITLDATNESGPDASNGFDRGFELCFGDGRTRASSGSEVMAGHHRREAVVALGPGDGTSSRQESGAARSLFELVSQTSSDFAVADEPHLLASLVESDPDAVIKEHTELAGLVGRSIQQASRAESLIAARPMARRNQ